jgi:hypothetical protein
MTPRAQHNRVDLAVHTTLNRRYKLSTGRWDSGTPPKLSACLIMLSNGPPGEAWFQLIT